MPLPAVRQARARWVLQRLRAMPAANAHMLQLPSMALELEQSIFEMSVAEDDYEDMFEARFAADMLLSRLRTGAYEDPPAHGCSTCAKRSQLWCPKCLAPYCGAACQRADWRAHKPHCSLEGHFAAVELANDVHIYLYWAQVLVMFDHYEIAKRLCALALACSATRDVRADLMLCEGKCHYSLGDYEQAAAAFSRSLSARAVIYGREHWRTAVDAVYLAIAEFRLHGGDALRMMQARNDALSTLQTQGSVDVLQAAEAYLVAAALEMDAVAGAAGPARALWEMVAGLNIETHRGGLIKAQAYEQLAAHSHKSADLYRARAAKVYAMLLGPDHPRTKKLL